MKVLGVLGGMGPAATTDFLMKLQAATPASRDADHVRVLMDLNPRVPDRMAEPEAATAELGRMAERLKAMGAEVLAMPCNTAHATADGIRAAGLPFVDMIAETTRVAIGSGARTVGVLATPGGEALYRAALEEAGAAVVLPEGEGRPTLLALIQGVKAGDVGPEARAAMAALAAELVGRGAEAVIAGCTEVPLLLSAEDVTVAFADSAEVLARACVEACR
ncbi:aspartate/glutamate racemase family protein [Brevundimonas sp. VNH65]|uniref:aspartate/glutamate racemase family protein n=1 Tax=Brevundimonas sp. VNH65 TaxID=3400917 RepID=UPI003C09FE1D